MAVSNMGPVADRSGGPAVPLWARVVATGCFSGTVPFASGTIGSFVGLLLYLVPGVSSPAVLAPLIVVSFLAGRAAAARVASALGHALHTDAASLKGIFQPGDHEHPDPSVVVIDEITGMWIALLFLPLEFPAIIIAFSTFRLFDILKPPPARWLEKFPRGWGIMLDDVAAGIYANLVTWLALGFLA